MTDITYTSDSLFTTFYPESKAGETAWREIANQMQGVAKVLNQHREATLYQLRKAGYKVKKAKPVKISDDELLAELII